MRSWIKALLISFIILATCIFFLPLLAKPSLNSLLPWLMSQADLEQQSIHISRLSWNKLTIDNIQFSAPAVHSTFSAQQIELTYSPSSLLSGRIHTASIQAARLEQKPPAVQASAIQRPPAQSSTISNPPTANSDSAPVVLGSLSELFQQLPFDRFVIEQFELLHPQANISAKLVVDDKALILDNSLHSPLLEKGLMHAFSIDHLGDIRSVIYIAEGKNSSSSSAPIFNLQAHWSVSSDTATSQTAEHVILNAQQSADIQSWLALLSADQNTQALSADIAIQAATLDLSLPRTFSSAAEVINQVWAQARAQGMFQIKINNLSMFDRNTQSTIIKGANLALNVQADIDPLREQQWQFTIDALDASSAINNLAPVNITLQQQLTDTIKVGCTLLPEQQTCQWQGALKQTITAPELSHQTKLSLAGSFTQHASPDNVQYPSEFISRQTVRLETQQHNAQWPKGDNSSHGEVIVQGQLVENNWHWQLSLPFGFINKSRYLEPILLTEGEKKSPAKLSDVHWRLLPDWQVSGINGEITSSKPIALTIDQLKLQHNKRIAKLENASISCNLDWLKFQYSPQLRSQQALSQLPLFCDWSLKNKPSNWQQWPIPAFDFSGALTLSSLDFNSAKLDTQMKLTGLANKLDLTLLAQHDFSGTPHGSAQLYLNNLKLDWKELGLMDMEQLTQVQLLAGSISAQGWFKWEQYQTDIFDDASLGWRWQPDVMLRIDDMAGIYQEITTWEDIDIQLALRRPFYQDFRIDSQVSALSIHPGIEINNILARSTTTIKEDFSQALIVIEEVHSDVLGGRINVPLIRFDTSQDVNSFGIEVEGLELEQLAALESGSGIEASGRLDGLLPIILLPEGPQVPAGSLFARSPGGTVKYRGASAESLKQSDPSVGLAMQVLNDFRYDRLQTDVTYQPNGELILGLQFQGHNPTFFDGQATHLNLNLEYNLHDLLESLRISNDIVQKLENKYQ